VAALRPTLAPPGSWWTYSVKSQGVAISSAQLVDFARKAAARAPLFPAPKPSEWLYTETFAPAGEGGKSGLVLMRPVVVQHWHHIDSERPADSSQRGTLRFSREGTPDGHLGGWPGEIRTLYAYLAKLPNAVPALRKVILTNDQKYGGDPGNFGVFESISALLQDLPVPPRLQAELYGVLASLPGVRFETSVHDGAGRVGVGLYFLQGGWLKQEI